jgi:hypothetical protein
MEIRAQGLKEEGEGLGWTLGMEGATESSAGEPERNVGRRSWRRKRDRAPEAGRTPWRNRAKRAGHNSHGVGAAMGAPASRLGAQRAREATELGHRSKPKGEQGRARAVVSSHGVRSVVGLSEVVAGGRHRERRLGQGHPQRARSRRWGREIATGEGLRWYSMPWPSLSQGVAEELGGLELK